MWGWKRRILHSDIGEVLYVKSLKGMNSSDGPALFILDKRGRRFLYLVSYSWNATDISRLVRAIPREWTTVKGATSRAQVRRRFPGAVPLWEAYPYPAGLVVAAALIGLTFLLWHWLT